MTAEEETVLMIKGVISQLPQVDREACEELADHFRLQMLTAGDPVGSLALALVGAEMQLAQIESEH